MQQCERVLSEKRKDMHDLLNTIAGEQYAKQLQEKRETEQVQRDQAEAQRILMLESEARDMYWSAFQAEGYTRQRFEEEWPSLWKDIQKQRALERTDAPKCGPAAAAF